MVIYLYYLYCTFLFSMMGIILLSNSVLIVLIFMEAMILSLFCLILVVFSSESLMEMLLFLTVVVGESILGLVLMILKLGLSGFDLFELDNVI